MRTKYKLLTLATTLLLGVSVNSFALPFIIVPDGTLPTIVPQGGTVDAAYTVTNNTTVTRTGNVVEYLPPNVTQNTSSGCGAIFNLASGASCVLNLVVSGPVSSNDPDPHHHLFVCMSDHTTCAGTNYPLNVTVNPTPPAPDAEYPLLSGNAIVGTDDWILELDSTSVLPTSFSAAGVINSVSCSNLGCIAGGSYTGSGSLTYPSLAVGTAGGKNWSYSLDEVKGTMPFDFLNKGVFNDVNCSGDTCVAGGSYESTDGNFYPMLAVSSNGGVNWSYSVERGTGTPSDFVPNNSVESVAFTSVTCSSTSYCIAVGYYQGSTGGDKQDIMIATTTNGGTNWTYEVSGVSGLPPGFQFGVLNSVACTGSGVTAVCVTGGYYNFAGEQFFPLLALSTDGGTIWTYQITEANPPVNMGTSGIFNSVSCSGATTSAVCAAAGFYDVAGTFAQYSLLALSTNGGTVWTYPVEQNVNPPSGGIAGNAQFIGVSCTGSTTTTICAAGGQYGTSTTSYPMLIVTTNGGSTWGYQVDAAHNLPTSIDLASFGAFFESVSCTGTTSTAICAAGGRYDVSIDANDYQYPMLIVSSNAGAASPVWAYAVEFATNDTLPSDFVAGAYNSVSCTGGTSCVAGGAYQNFVTHSLEYSPLEVSVKDGNTNDPKYFASLGIDFTMPTASLSLSPLGSSEGEASRVIDWL